MGNNRIDKNSKKDEKILKDDKHAPKIQKILSISEATLQAATFVDHKLASVPASTIVDLLKQIKRLSLLLSLIDKLDKNERSEIEKEFEQAINTLTKKLKEFSNDEEMLSVKIQDKLFGDVVYDISLALAKVLPRNLIDVITQQEIDTIPEKDSLYTSDRSKFEIHALVGYINSVGKFKHPEFRTEFNARDIDTIRKFAKQHNLELKIENAVNQKRVVQNPTPLDIDAIEVAVADNLRFFRQGDGQNQVVQQREIPPDHAEEINTGLRYLAQTAILTIPNRNALIEHVQYANNINEGLQVLVEAKIATQQNYDLIIQHSRNRDAYLIAFGLAALNQVGLLSVANRQTLIGLDPPSLAFDVGRTARMFRPELIPATQQNLTVLFQNAQHGYEIFLAMDTLSMGRLQTQDNYLAIMQNPQYATNVANGLYNLEQAGILTSLNREAIVAHADEAERFSQTLILEYNSRQNIPRPK